MRLQILHPAAVLLIAVGFAAAQAPPSGDTFVLSATPRINYGPGITKILAPSETL